METIEYSVKDEICCIALNRPEVRNAFNSTMTFELSRTLEALNQDDDVRAVIITGNGKAFSAGADIREGMGMWDKLKSEREARPIPDLLVEEFNKPVIAAINGAAIGFGLTVTLSCDIRVAAESALMSMRFTQLGMIPEAGSPYLLPRIVGLANALDLSLTAKNVDAREAYRIGLVNYVVPDDQLMPKSLEVARNIAIKSPTAISTARRSFYDSLELSFAEQRKREREDFDKCLNSDEFRAMRKKFRQLKKE